MKVFQNRLYEIHSAASEMTPEGLEKAKVLLKAMVEETTAIASGTAYEAFVEEQIVLIKQELNVIS